MVEIEIEAAVDFQPLWGDVIEVVLMRVVETDDEDIMAEVVMLPTAFAQVMGTESFGLLEEAISFGRPEELDPEQAVRLELRLRPSLRAFIAEGIDAEIELAELIARALGGEHALASIVRQTEAWLVCTATQRVVMPDAPDELAEIGIKTAWAR